MSRKLLILHCGVGVFACPVVPWQIFSLVAGAFNVINGGVATSALANLGSVEGELDLKNGQTATVASLTTTSGSYIILTDSGTALTVTGNASSYGTLFVGTSTVLNVGGTLTIHSPSECCGLNNFLQVAGTANIGTLDNEGTVLIGPGGEACIGSLTNDGTLIVDGGTLNGTGCAETDYTLTEIIASADSFGVFDYSGPITLGGTLDVELQNGFIPTVGESFDFIQFPAGDLTGTFASITNDLFNNNTEQWEVTYDNTDGEVILTVEARHPLRNRPR